MPWWLPVPLAIAALFLTGLIPIGLFAGFLMMFLLLFKVFPMISAWEMRDAAGEEGPAY